MSRKDPEPGPAEPGNEPKEPEVAIPTPNEELTRLQQERDQFEDQLKRALADTQNIRRRQRQELDDTRQRTMEGIVQELLPVLDSFAAALQHWDEGTGQGDPKAVVDGVRMVRVLLSGALERHGLGEIQAAGCAFDPAVHEAVAVEPSDQVPPGQVLRVLQPGYRLGERVVRHARVVVSAEPKKE